jgi:hypothetical protein
MRFSFTLRSPKAVSSWTTSYQKPAMAFRCGFSRLPLGDLYLLTSSEDLPKPCQTIHQTPAYSLHAYGVAKLVT